MIKIEVDISEVVQLVTPWKNAQAWVRPEIAKHVPLLGKKISSAMREQIAPHRYTGDLEGSINHEWDAGPLELHVGPNAKRGSHDAGMIFQEGTPPAGAPWKKIRAWGDFRGLTRQHSFFILQKIRRSGVSPHPFLVETLNRGDVRAAIEDMANKTGLSISARAVAGGKTLGVATFD